MGRSGSWRASTNCEERTSVHGRMRAWASESTGLNASGMLWCRDAACVYVLGCDEYCKRGRP